MLDIAKKIIDVLINDATLTAIVPAANIFTGPVDIVIEKQTEFFHPMVILSLVSESSRSVPSNVRDTVFQIDIYDRNTYLEMENIYEKILEALNYLSYNEGDSHIFWQRMSASNDDYDSDRRVWHRSFRFTAWSQGV